MTSPPWQLRPADASAVADIAATLGCPEPIAAILAARGVIGSEALRRFFEPSLTDLHPPSLLLGMDRAVARIRQAVTRGESILIYGDYDVDGTIATVLLKTAIERIAPPGTPAQVSWHVPHRVREGYGIQSSRLAEAYAAGVRLVISVDTGIRAFAAARDARALGLDLIVTDHHLTDDAAGVPDALSVINPAQPVPLPLQEPLRRRRRLQTRARAAPRAGTNRCRSGPGTDSPRRSAASLVSEAGRHRDHRRLRPAHR